MAQPVPVRYREDSVAEALTTSPSEALATLAAQFGGGEGVELVDHLVRRHPSARMRRTALDVLAGKAETRDAPRELYARAARDGDAAVAAHARHRLVRIGH